MESIIPPNRGITPEAAEALQNQGIQVSPDDIASEANETNIVDAEIVAEEFYDDGGISDPFPALTLSPPVEGTSGMSSGDSIPDVGMGNESDRPERSPATASGRSRQTRDDDTFRDNAKSGPPNLAEWEKFFSRIVLRVACDWYLSYAFRGIDEDALSEREVERLALTDEEKRMVSIPFAELSNKSKFMRKHGRMIVSSGDAFNSMIVMGAWMSRVNRIANRYRPRVIKAKVNGASQNGNSGQSTPETSGNFEGTSGGRINGEYRIYNPGTS